MLCPLSTILLSVLALSAPGPEASPPPIAAAPLPHPAIPGYSFPEAEATLTAQIDALYGPENYREYQSAFAEIHLHAWGLWTALTSETDQRYEGQALRVFETWPTPEDLNAEGSSAVWHRGLTDLAQLRSRRLARRDAGAGAPDDDRLVGYVKYDPVSAAQIRSQNLLKVDALQALLAGGAVQIPAFPAAALVVKTIYKVVDPGTLAEGRYFLLPAWSGPPVVPQAWGPTRWPGCVWVDLLGGGSGTGATDAIAAADGSSRTDATTYPVSAFIHFPLSASDAAALNLQRPGIGANPGDTALLVGMHVAGRETARWTWQTFWWAPAPDTPPAPSSRVIAAARPAELQGAPRHYAMALAYAMQAPSPPVVGGENAGRGVYAYNPWIEAAFTPADLPDSIPGPDPDGQPAANDWGVQTNCMSCHARATFAPAALATVPRFAGDRYVDLLDPQFVGTLQTDFLWSLPRLAQ